jgi:hypothetical protein
MPRLARAASAAAGLAILTTPAVADAAAIVAPPCARTVLAEKTVPVQGTGFTPNSFVRLTSPDGKVSLGGAATDAAGSFSDVFFGSTLLPSVRSTKATVALVGTDSAGVAAAPLSLDVVRITADLPDRAKPRSRVRYRVLGFETGRTVYLHIRRGGKTRGTFKVGTAKGDCGIATRRMRYMPLRSYRTGRYDYYFQHTRKYDRTAPRVKLSISIIRRLRSR